MTLRDLDKLYQSSLEKYGLKGAPVQSGRNGNNRLWLHSKSSREIILPKQGFKLHISATIVSATKVLDVAVPFLLEQKIPFKVPRNLGVLMKLNAGEYSLSQVGKFITVYPPEGSCIVTLAQRLHDLTSEFSGPRVPSDNQICEGSNVSYRFGRLLIEDSEIKDGIADLSAPDGIAVSDARRMGGAVPKWVDDPFLLKVNREHKYHSPSSPFGSRFVVLSVLSQRPKGGVYRAIEYLLPQSGEKNLSEVKNFGLSRRVIIKEGRYCGEVEPSGIDACDRILWQWQAHTCLSDVNGLVQAHELLEYERNRYLVMEDAGDRSLREIILKEEMNSLSSIATIIRYVSLALREMHARKMTFFDLSPGNIVMNVRGHPILVDLEYVTGQDSPVISVERVGTPGFYPKREENNGCFERLVGRDIYALGVILYVLLMPEWYRAVLSQKDNYSIAWERPDLPANIPMKLQKLYGGAMKLDGSVGIDDFNVKDI